jgi:hypothetical protein
MMLALSLRQPWAHFVLHWGKRIENRRWNTNVRGEFLIHAAKGMRTEEYQGAMQMLDEVAGLQPVDVLPVETLQRGGIVGVARLVGVVKPRPEFMIGGVAAHYPGDLKDHGWRWHMREQFGFCLTDVRATTFVPWKGSLGFFRVPDDIAARAMQDVP